MTQRLDYTTIAPEAVRPLFEAGKITASSSLEPALQLLVQIRVSQLNRCALCLALHMREAEALGERGDRLSGLVAWREAPWYSPRERAGLEWAEALTSIERAHPGDELFARVRKHFNDKELVHLTLAINAIGAWNRFNVAFGTPPELADAVFQQMHAAPASPVHA